MANGKQLSQKGAEEILDIIDSYIDVKEVTEELFKKKPLGYEMKPELEIYTDGFNDGYNKCKEELNQKGLALQSDMDKTIEQNIALKKKLEKANEWHKQEVYDIYDLISEDWSVRYFICIMKDKIRVTAIGNCDEGCNGEVSVNLFFEHDDEKYYIDDIVWWKEIVLPKESE